MSAPDCCAIFLRGGADLMEISVSVAAQSLTLHHAGVTQSWPVSTSRNGVGEQRNSYRTPLGRHYIRAKVGAGLAAGSVLRGRRPTGAVITPELLAQEPERDWITTRILWLCGLEPGRNRGGVVDSMARYIYIHGTPQSAQIGTPGSIGCVRMTDAAVIELYDLVAVGTGVTISAD